MYGRRMRHIGRVEGHSFIEEYLGDAAVVVDLGANEGRFSRHFLCLPACRVLAVEPAPDLFAHLPDLPGLAKSRSAVMAESGQVELHLNPGRCASAYLPEETAHTVIVRGVTLSSLLSDFGIEHMDLLKMDIEGAEVSVIESTPNDVLLRADQITVEFHDFLDSTLKVSVDRAIDRLRALGFQPLQMSHTDRSDLLFINPRLHLSILSRAVLLARYRWVHGIGRRATAIRRKLLLALSSRAGAL
jgi:FkbM family methyltransferase